LQDKEIKKMINSQATNKNVGMAKNLQNVCHHVAVDA
jgi:hypothetical protein